MAKRFNVLKTSEFEEWLGERPAKSRAIIIARLDMISIGHFGAHKRFEGLIELRWLNGTRVYSFMWGSAIVVAFTEEIKMAKAATSKKRKKSATNSLRAHESFASGELKDSHLVAEALIDCIKSGDLKAFREVLVSHLMTANKSEIAKKAGIGRRTLYDLMDPEKAFNPELSTIAAVIKSLAA